MPVYDFICIKGHTKEVFEKTRDDLGCETVICKCGNTMAPVPSYGRGLLFFEEGRGRWIHNLGVNPVYITSKKQHIEAMNRAGLMEAPAELPTRGHSRISTKGKWI